MLSFWKFPRKNMWWAPFWSTVQSTFVIKVFQTSGVGAVNRYPAVFRPSPAVESFGAG